MLSKLTLICGLSVFALSLINAQPAEWIQGLNTTLQNIGCSDFAQALLTANLSLSATDDLTLFCPTTFTQPLIPEIDKRITYHIVSGRVNTSTDVARPRKQTIAVTELRNPGPQPVILETAPSLDGTILIRGSDWNASSSGSLVTFGNMLIQPMDKAFIIPLPATTVLTHALHSTAPSGAPVFLSWIKRLELSTELECEDCTLLVPNDEAMQSVNTTGLDEEQQRNIIRTHILRGTRAYTPTLTGGQFLINDAGGSMVYGVNDTNAFFVGQGRVTAVVLRGNIITQHGVIHLVNAVLPGHDRNEGIASSAFASRSQASESEPTISGVIGRLQSTKATGSNPVSSQSATFTPSSSAKRVSAPSPFFSWLASVGSHI